MPAERLPMMKLRELMRLTAMGVSARKIAIATGVARSTVAEYQRRIRTAGLTWPLPPELDDDLSLSARLFEEDRTQVRGRPEPDWARVHAELRRKGVTKALLWEEYRSATPDGYQYSHFCDLYARWSGRVNVTMRQEHRAGEKMFVDFSGDGIELIDEQTGEVRKAKLFVAVLGGSNLTYVEAVLDESLPTWTRCHVNAFAYFGGAPEILVPDNLRAGIDKPNRYEALVNRTYDDLARHYDTVVMPARVRKPRDKAKAEQGVLLAQRWIIAALRNRRFTNINAIAEAIDPLLEKLNNKPMRLLGKSRRQIFDEVERATLKPLPSKHYEFATWSRARVSIDYHIAVEGHFYSAPYQLVREMVEVRATATTVEILLRNRRVASHPRSYIRGGTTTQDDHMPVAHHEYKQWTPSRIEGWASKSGPSVAAAARRIMESKRHPALGYRACLGIIRLGEKYGVDRLEKACARALELRACSYRNIESMLRHNRDRVADERVEAALPTHGNVRGAAYFH